MGIGAVLQDGGADQEPVWAEKTPNGLPGAVRAVALAFWPSSKRATGNVTAEDTVVCAYLFSQHASLRLPVHNAGSNP